MNPVKLVIGAPLALVGFGLVALVVYAVTTHVPCTGGLCVLSQVQWESAIAPSALFGTIGVIGLFLVYSAFSRRKAVE